MPGHVSFFRWQIYFNDFHNMFFAIKVCPGFVMSNFHFAKKLYFINTFKYIINLHRMSYNYYYHAHIYGCISIFIANSSSLSSFLLNL